MSEKIFQNLNGVPQTLLMTLYVRASESGHPDAMIKDNKAVEVVSRIECDFSRLKMHWHDEIAVIMCMRKFDRHMRDFLTRNPDSVLVHIGADLTRVSSVWTMDASNDLTLTCRL